MKRITSDKLADFIKKHNDKKHKGSKKAIYFLELYCFAGMFNKGMSIFCKSCNKAIVIIGD